MSQGVSPVFSSVFEFSYFVSKTFNWLNLCIAISFTWNNDFALMYFQPFSLHSCYRFESQLIVKYWVVTETI